MDGVTAILWLLAILAGFFCLMYAVIQFLKWW